MPELDDRYQKDENIVSRNIAGETILVPIRQKMGDLESIFTLNETASCAWEALDGIRTLGEVNSLITSEFEVNPDQAGQDLLELIAQLESIGAVIKV